MAMFHLLKIRMSTDIFKNKSVKLLSGLSIYERSRRAVLHSIDYDVNIEK